jgi:hypothetical protein
MDAQGVFAPLPHRLRVLIETLLHGFEHVLVLPSPNAPLRSARALWRGHYGHAVLQEWRSVRSRLSASTGILQDGAATEARPGPADAL